MCQHQCGFSYACTCTFLHSCGHHADVPGLVHDQEVVVLVYDGHSRALIAISCVVKFRAALGACTVPQSEHAKLAGCNIILSPFLLLSLSLKQKPTRARAHTHKHKSKEHRLHLWQRGLSTSSAIAPLEPSDPRAPAVISKHKDNRRISMVAAALSELLPQLSTSCTLNLMMHGIL